MFTLTKGDREIIGQNQEAINDLSSTSLKENAKLKNSNLSEDAANKIIRRIRTNNKQIKRLAEQNEAIIKRAFDEYKKIID